MDAIQMLLRLRRNISRVAHALATIISAAWQSHGIFYENYYRFMQVYTCSCCLCLEARNRQLLPRDKIYIKISHVCVRTL